MNSYGKPSYGTNYLAYAKPDICPIGPTQTKESPCDFPPPNFDAIFQIVSPLKIALAAAACFSCWTANQRIEAASHSPFEDLSKRLSKRISDIMIKTVVVADITDSHGTACPEGLYLADLLSAYLIQPGRKLRVVNRDLLRGTRAVQKITARDLTSSETLHKIGTAIVVDAVVFGTVEKSERKLTVSVFAKRVSDGRLLGSENAAVERSAFFDSLTRYSATPTLAEPQRVGGNGVTPPECLDCPVPQFRHRADASSRAMLSVGVSSEGRVVAVKVLRGAGPEFADEAWGMLRVFRYNPAHDRSGQPVAVSIFVEIFFS